MFDFAAARDHMVESQVRTNDVTDVLIQKALRQIPRERFMPDEKSAMAYSDANVSIDEGRYMLRPRDFSKMLQAADIKPTDVVLDIACARGYSCAILAQLAETVIGLEATQDAVDTATQLLADNNIMNAVVVKGDLKGGAPEHGPFDVIFVNGAVVDLPKSWLDQLAGGGRLVVVQPDGPVGQARIYTRIGDSRGGRIAFDAQIPIIPGFEAKAEFVL